MAGLAGASCLVRAGSRVAARGRAAALSAALPARAAGVRALASSSSSPRAAAEAAPAADAWAGLPGPAEIRMLYDGDCPLCEREVDMLKARDAGVGKIDFVDISSPSYRPEEHRGISFERAMASIHAIRADGSVLDGVTVFRELYEKVGLGWVYAITRWEPAAKAAEAVYDFWAARRLAVTGRPGIEFILANRNEAKTCKEAAAGGD